MVTSMLETVGEVLGDLEDLGDLGDATDLETLIYNIILYFF
jgi:hypothetical protein